jgi:hypothetical protein
MIRLVPVSIAMAGAALEASANEIILLRDVKRDRSGNSIDKYRTLAFIFR